MEIMDYKGRFYIPYQDSSFKIQKSKDEYELVAINKSNGKSKTLFKGNEDDCKLHRKQIHEAYQRGCLFYYF